MKTISKYVSASIFVLLLIYNPAKTEELNDNSNTVCLKKVQSVVILDSHIEILDIYNRSYSGIFKNIDYRKNKLLYVKQEFGVEDILTKIRFEDISQVIVSREKFNNKMFKRWAKIGILTGVGFGLLRAFKKDENNNFNLNNDDFSFIDFLTYGAIGGGIGSIIGLISGKNIIETHTINCR